MLEKSCLDSNTFLLAIMGRGILGQQRRSNAGSGDGHIEKD